MANNIGNVAIWLLGGACLFALTVPPAVWSGGAVSELQPQIGELINPETVGVIADVFLVRSGGMWTEGDTEGHYKVIISNHGLDHIVSKLYLQWLELEPENGTFKIRKTVGFAALNDMPVYNLEVAGWTPQGSSLRVDLDAYNSYSGEKSHFILDAAAPGAATLINRER